MPVFKLINTKQGQIKKLLKPCLQTAQYQKKDKLKN